MVVSTLVVDNSKYGSVVGSQAVQPSIIITEVTKELENELIWDL